MFDSGSESKSPPTFTHFPLLPLELRLKIYSYVNHQSRTVTLFCQPSKKDEEEPRWVSLTSVPAMLHVSRETREEALLSYELAFGSTYFNFSRDTLRFGNPQYMDFRGEIQNNYTLRSAASRQRVWTDRSPIRWNQINEQVGAEGCSFATLIKFYADVDEAWKVQLLEVDQHQNPSLPFGVSAIWVILKLLCTEFHQLRSITFVSWPVYDEEGGERPNWGRRRMLKVLGDILVSSEQRAGDGAWRVPEITFVDMFSGRVWGALGLDLVNGFEFMAGDAEGKNVIAADLWGLSAFHIE